MESNESNSEEKVELPKGTLASLLDKAKVTPRWARLALGGASLLAAGYLIGRYAQPEKVLVTEKVVTVEKQVVVEKEKLKVERVLVENTQKRTHTEEHEVKHPDGTEERNKTVDENVDTVVHDKDVVYVDRDVVRVVEKENIVEKMKLVENARPGWIVGVNAGVSAPYYLSGGGRTGLTQELSGLVLGAEASRRILGPFYVGLWGNTQGTFGLGVKVNF